MFYVVYATDLSLAWISKLLGVLARSWSLVGVVQGGGGGGGGGGGVSCTVHEQKK